MVVGVINVGEQVRLVHFVIRGRHTSMECSIVCVLEFPKGKFSKQMKNKYLVTEL
jgi:hypothetical protein